MGVLESSREALDSLSKAERSARQTAENATRELEAQIAGLTAQIRLLETEKASLAGDRDRVRTSHLEIDNLRHQLQDVQRTNAKFETAMDRADNKIKALTAAKDVADREARELQDLVSFERSLRVKAETELEDIRNLLRATQKVVQEEVAQRPRMESEPSVSGVTSGRVSANSVRRESVNGSTTPASTGPVKVMRKRSGSSSSAMPTPAVATAVTPKSEHGTAPSATPQTSASAIIDSELSKVELVTLQMQLDKSEKNIEDLTGLVARLRMQVTEKDSHLTEMSRALRRLQEEVDVKEIDPRAFRRTQPIKADHPAPASQQPMVVSARNAGMLETMSPSRRETAGESSVRTVLCCIEVCWLRRHNALCVCRSVFSVETPAVRAAQAVTGPQVRAL